MPRCTYSKKCPARCHVSWCEESPEMDYYKKALEEFNKLHWFKKIFIWGPKHP